MKAIKTTVFLLLMMLCVAVLWQAIRREPSRWIPEALMIFVFVLLMQMGLSRVSAGKRKSATIMVASGLLAIAAGGEAVFRFLLIRSGFDGAESLVEGAAAAAVFVVCGAVSVWLLLRLRRTPVS